MMPVPPARDRLVFSLIELLEAKKIQEISVAEIARNASVSLRSFYNYFPDKYALMAYSYRKLTERFWWDASGHLVSLNNFFEICWSLEDDPIMMTRLKNTMAYHGQNDLRDEIERKGIEDLTRLLKANHFPGPFDETLQNILQFFMSGIVRICELHFMNEKEFPSTWLADYGVKCLPATISEYMLREPSEFPDK